MSKFEELCQAYAVAKKTSLESRQACQDFTDVFLKRMSDYFQCPIKKEKINFDQQGLMHVETSLTLYENPTHPELGTHEIVIISWSIEKILDNYVVTIYPWMKEFKIFWDEFSKFDEVYQFLFETIKETYIGEILLPEEEGKSSIRHLGFGF